ncbi:transporter substrate-binding domain-containing protein [Actinotignum sanguinis]|uniref:Transporter substrate-binding domain-containing protein n=1 Tax=Actinotignum sanguinis TaxID=1445614 RepID=A0ABT5V6D1_9ACTO|nr:transporter substrate-binding domain-containing protein [Actinotignum sanguinis]MDE1655726.1 transporter substrate-binding domain-containing protein [Actinotignum sanguinis]
MKKIFKVLAAGLAAVTVLSGCGAKKDSLAQIEETGKIKVGIEGTFVPYGYHDKSGKLVGFEVEIAQLIAQDLGVEPEFVETKWDSLIAGLDTGKYDIVTNNINPTEERRKKYDFTAPYAISRSEILVKKGSGITKLEDLKGKKCAQTPSSDYGQTAAAAGADIVPSQGFSESTQLVINGQADCTVNDVVTVSDFLKKTSATDLDGIKVPGAEPVQISVMLAKGSEPLKEKLNESIAKGLSNGSYAKIFEKYIGEDISPN